MLRDIEFFYTRKAHFYTALLAMFFFLFPFMHVGYIATAGILLTKPKQTIELCKYRVHVPLLLAKKLRLGHSAINDRSSFNTDIYWTIVQW